MVFSGIVVSTMGVLIFHTQFFLEDFKDVFFSFEDFLDDTFVFERFGLKIVPSDFAIRADEAFRDSIGVFRMDLTAT